MAKKPDNRNTRVAVRLDAVEKRMADTVAKLSGLNISDWFRLTLRQAYEQARPVRKPPTNP
jgi:antitoxin component of RelBE/YafQ-DinJ toxin-antitoxin module